MCGTSPCPRTSRCAVHALGGQTRGTSRENAKQTFFAVLFCLGATVYAFIEKGWPYGLLGIVLTILVYLFSSRTGKPKTKEKETNQK